jgi:hypothetical protein
MTKMQDAKYIATRTAMSTTNRPLLTPMICSKQQQQQHAAARSQCLSTKRNQHRKVGHKQVVGTDK